jgi:hypothetical protein
VGLSLKAHGMGDLQNFFENMTTKEFGRLVNISRKKNWNPISEDLIINYVDTVYQMETGESFWNIENDDEAADIAETFLVFTQLYESLMLGRIEIDGRMILTDPFSCRFNLTQKGRLYTKFLKESKQSSL